MTTDHATPRMRHRPPGAVDFTMMFLTHDALLRDLDRLRAALSEGRAAEPAVRAGWETLKHELHVHHVGEDQAVWPPLREKVTRDRDRDVLDRMEAEHALIDPLQERIDAHFEAGGRELDDAVEAFATALAQHLEHEEEEALPLAEVHLGPEGWAAYTQHMIQSQGMDEVGLYLSWVLDAVSAADRAKVLGMLPGPMRQLLENEHEPRYHGTPRWTATA